MNDPTGAPAVHREDATRTSAAGPDGKPGDPAAPASGFIGPYRILGKLGEGGMGVVFEAEQRSPKRRVALKIIRGGEFVDDARVRMFQREAETLARLKHPNIGAIYEAGHTDDGRHFFAMELVQGDTLDKFLEKRPVSITPPELRYRLGLFRKICDAVHYAHQRGVIHRDLKPSNIIVTDEGDVSGATGSELLPLPGIKILDFGLARITDQDVHAATVLTEVGMIKGTLPYMSPEQARGQADAIDVRTDVYALGVLLYEMLAGIRPYDIEKSALLEAVRVICEEPPRPLRQTLSGTRKLDSDVETIAGKALEKEPDRRYASAAALGEDIGRYLASQPILARPPSAAYQLKKLVQRHRVPAAFAVVLLVLLAGFGVAMAVLYGRSESNLRRALVAEQDARENFDLARGAVDRYLTRVTESPEMEARGLEDLRRQLLATAQEFYESLAKRRSDSEELKAELANAHHRLAWISRIVGDQDRAEQAYRDGIRTMEELIEADPDNRSYRYTLAVLVSNLALVLQETGRIDEAEVEYGRAVEMEGALLQADPDSPLYRSQHGNTLDNFAQLLDLAGRFEDAEQKLREALDLRRRLAADVPDEPAYRNVVLQSGVNLSGLYSRLGRLEEAEQVLSEALPLGESLVAEYPRNAEYRHALAAALGNLGGVQMLLGRFEPSAETYRRELELREPLVLDHPAVLDYRLKLASTYTNLGELDTRTERYATALPWYDKSIETLGWVLDREPDHAIARFFLSYTHAWKARALDGLGRHAAAVEQWDLAIRYDDRADPALKEARDHSRRLGAAGGS